MSRLFRSAIILALFAISSSIALHADPLPPLSYVENVFASGYAGSSGGSVLHSGSSFPYGLPVQGFVNDGQVQVAAEITGSTDPSVLTQFEMSGVPGGPYPISRAQSTLKYYFEVTGPAGETVPVEIGSKGGAYVLDSHVASFGADAFLTISPTSGGSTDLLSAIACAGDTSHLASPLCTENPGSPATFNVSGAVDVQTNTPYLVTIGSEIYFTNLYPTPPIPDGVLGAQSGVDPTITLDTTDPHYSLTFSPGLTPDASPVPEPGTLALTLSGIAALALASLRRRSYSSWAP